MKHALHSRLALIAAVTALIWGLSSTAQAQSQDLKNLQTLQAQAPLALSHAETTELMQNFSTARPRFSQNGGENLYQAICQACHMVKGEGAKGAGFYPALASNPKLAAAAYPIAVVMNGLHGMPSFAQRLSDEQVAEVVGYVRTNFGNQYSDAVTATDVKAFRVAP